VGFLATLLAPILADLPAPLRSWGGIVLALAGTAALVARRRRAGTVFAGAAVAAFGLGLLLAPSIAGIPDPGRRTLAAAVMIASWWITVAIPIPATSLLPLVLFPVLGVMKAGTAATQYANNNIFLFMGGFIIALGIQRWGLHRRIALVIVRAIGTNPSRMVLGFMVASAFLSMWISNTATTLMMLPIAIAVIASMREVRGRSGIGGFAPALLLGVAHAATIGGIATKIGTPPNISFARILTILYPDAPEIAFSDWLLAFLPIAVVFLPLAWIVLTRVTHRVPRGELGAGREVIREELRKLGPMSPAEIRMLVVFALTALLWVFRGDIRLGDEFRIRGWAWLLERYVGGPFVAENLHDATVAMGMAVLCFLLPGDPDEQGRRRALMDWPTAKKLPWGILLLFGGGFALAKGFADSGLSQELGEAFSSGVSGATPLLLVVATCLLLTYLTEVTSNTATTEVILPVLAGAAGAMGVNPLLLMLPATISASCAFMLPVATPPNAIVFGSGEVEMRHMVRTGTVLNLVGVALVALMFYFFSSRILGLDLGSVPAWAAR
jgi:sodium-dependent dicarboxylate transporter 2/3/5